MIGDIHDHSHYAEKMQRCQKYIDTLEEERQKIQVFQRELPLCLELVTQAIEACRQQLPGTMVAAEAAQGQLECSEQTTSDGPVLEEFIPIKRCSSSDDDEQEYSHRSIDNCNGLIKDDKNTLKSSKKSDWLRSAQLSLCNQTLEPPTTKQGSPRKVSVVTEVKKNAGGDLHPLKREKSAGANPKTMATSPSSPTPAMASRSSTAVDVGCSGRTKKEEKDAQRKTRRCWSPELHKRFVNALQQLGGSHAATPKQIRELMEVDGLTNDEVKSHLQKYRLHTRRPSPSMHNSNNPQPPQFVVVGGIWVPPPPEYGAAAASGEPAMVNPNGIYEPIATTPAAPLPQTYASTSNKRPRPVGSGHSDCGGAHSNCFRPPPPPTPPRAPPPPS